MKLDAEQLAPMLMGYSGSLFSSCGPAYSNPPLASSSRGYLKIHKQELRNPGLQCQTELSTHCQTLINRFGRSRIGGSEVQLTMKSLV